jgi:hypothetical protein
MPYDAFVTRQGSNVGEPHFKAVYTDSVKQVDHRIFFFLSDGSIYTLPLEKVPILYHDKTSIKDRADFAFTDEGQTVYWNSLKMHVHLAYLLEVGTKVKGPTNVCVL